ncbi:MAG: hypothetical protein J7K68_02500 [Candidatus Diapherotrites archaeon]|nr:hypothetical protein [Candidatus Diapherotrites archaeon]
MPGRRKIRNKLARLRIFNARYDVSLPTFLAKEAVSRVHNLKLGAKSKFNKIANGIEI